MGEPRLRRALRQGQVIVKPATVEDMRRRRRGFICTCICTCIWRSYVSSATHLRGVTTISSIELIRRAVKTSSDGVFIAIPIAIPIIKSTTVIITATDAISIAIFIASTKS